MADTFRASAQAAQLRREEDATGQTIGGEEGAEGAATGFGATLSDMHKNVLGASSKALKTEKGGFLNHTVREWSELTLVGSLSILMLVFAGIYWEDCSVLPSLSANVALAGLLELVTAVVAFVMYTERKRKDMKETDSRESSLAVTLVDIMGVVLIGIAIWGAVLTFPNFNLMGDEEGKCSSGLFMVGFLSSVITLAIALWELGNALKKDEDNDEEKA